MTARKTLVLIGSEERMVLVDKLSEMGLHVYTCNSIQEALGNLRHHVFSSIILDHHNDEIDPLELVLNVREIDGNVPVIILGESKEALTNEALDNQRKVFCITGTSAELRERITSIVG